MTTLLLKLRSAAQEVSDVTYRAAMRQGADELFTAVDALHQMPTDENMRTLQGCWAVAHRLLKNIPPEGTPAPLSGAPEPARLAA